MLTLRDKIKTGGIMGAIHVFVSIILSFVAVVQLNLSGKAILWNILVFNLPVFLDFVHTFNCVPAEKVGRHFKCMLTLTVVGLSVSVILAFIGIGILLNDSNIQNFLSDFWGFGKLVLRSSILLNPIGVLAEYMCSILIEEHRIETEVEVDTN